MIIIKTPKEIEILREGGRRLATVLHKVKEKVAPGVSALELDEYAYNLIREMGDEPAFLNYRPSGAKSAFPASLCVSINNEVVHGIPKADRILQEGNIVSIDLGLKHQGLFTDMAMTVPVGSTSSGAMALLETTRRALEVAIDTARPGNTVGDIGHAVESFVHSKKIIKKYGKYGIVEELSGHGVGRAIHEDPYIPNFGRSGHGAKLVSGMVVALEPMLTSGTKEVVLDPDGYTFRTKDGKKSAHFEHTILITEDDAEILTLV
jgi:methionyl aminopeptidase